MKTFHVFCTTVSGKCFSSLAFHKQCFRRLNSTKAIQTDLVCYYLQSDCNNQNNWISWYFPFRIMEVVNKILTIVVVTTEIGKVRFSLHVSKPAENFLIPLFSFALAYLLFSSYFTEKSKEVEYRGGNSPPDLKGYFSSSSSSR